MNEKLLEGKVAVVTGSGQGIGRAIAIAFALQGAKVVTNNRKPGSTGSSMITEEQLNKLSAEKREDFIKNHAAENGDAETTAEAIRGLGGEATPIYCDITKIEDAKRLIDSTVEKYGRIDILCNVAGGFGFSDIENITPELWDHVNDVKPKGYFYTMKYAIPYMRAQKSGRILLCSSPAFSGGPLKQAEYCAANAGVLGLTRGAAMELVGDGITVNCFAPGAKTRAAFELEAAQLTHDSPIIIEGRQFMDVTRSPGPEHVAPFIVYLASDRSQKINGAVFIVGGSMIGIYPNPAPSKIIKKETETLWDYDELIDKIENELLEGYTALTD